MFKHAGFAAAALAASLAAAPAPAAVIVTFSEVGDDVVGSFSGSLTLPFLFGGSAASHTWLTPLNDEFVTRGDLAFATLDVYLASGPSPTTFAHDYGVGGNPGLTIATDNATGDAFIVNREYIGVPMGYVPGTPLAGTATFPGRSFVDISVLPGTYTYTLYNVASDAFDGDTVTLRFGPESATVPVPATLPLMLGALGGVAVAARRMRQRNGDTR